MHLSLLAEVEYGRVSDRGVRYVNGDATGLLDHRVRERHAEHAAHTASDLDQITIVEGLHQRENQALGTAGRKLRKAAKQRRGFGRGFYWAPSHSSRRWSAATTRCQL